MARERAECLGVPDSAGQVDQRRAVRGGEVCRSCCEPLAVDEDVVRQVEPRRHHLRGEEPGKDAAQVVDGEDLVPTRSGEDVGTGLALQRRSGFAPHSARHSVQERMGAPAPLIK